MRKQNLFLGGVLLVLLLFAYRVWTEEASPALTSGNYTIWVGSVDQIDSVAYSYGLGHIRIERRRDSEWGDYLWGTAVAADSDTLNFIPSPGFPVGIDGESIMSGMATLRAHREFGVLTEEQKSEYGFLTDSTATLVVYFRNGPREVTIGGGSFGSADRYAFEPTSGRGFVLPNDHLHLLEGGARFLLERRLHAYSREDVRSARLTSSGGEEVMVVNRPGELGTSSWSLQEEPNSVNPALTDFMERLNSLWFTDITDTADRSLLTSVARADFFGGDGRRLGYLELFRWDGIEGSPSYYLETEVTRAPVLVAYIDASQQIESEIARFF